MIPGRVLHRVATTLCSPIFSERVVEPLIADLQHEWRTAIGLVQALRTLASGYAAFWRALGLHALQVWLSELSCLTWRDAWPFPGAYAILMVSLAMANDWVRTGTVWNVWKASIDGSPTWAIVPLALAQRWIPTNGIRNIAIYIAMAYPVASVVLSRDVRPFLRGWGPFFIALCVITLVQPKKRAAGSIVETPHGD